MLWWTTVASFECYPDFILNYEYFCVMHKSSHTKSLSEFQQILKLRILMVHSVMIVVSVKSNCINIFSRDIYTRSNIKARQTLLLVCLKAGTLPRLVPCFASDLIHYSHQQFQLLWILFTIHISSSTADLSWNVMIHLPASLIITFAITFYNQIE